MTAAQRATLEVMVRSQLLVIALAAGGCDQVFDLTTKIPPDALVYDRCAPTAPDPLRYAAIASADASWSWDSARATCQLRGMDLAVINDVHELGMADVEIRPYWVGEQETGGSWSTVDGCPAFTAAAPIRPLGPGAAGDLCGVVDATTAIAGTSCDGSTTVISALCETPRADRGGCLPAHPGAETYALSPQPLSYADAQAFCTAQHGHLAVIDSSAELTHLSTLARTGAWTSFWLGARYAAGAWTTETGCPGLYSWTGGAPALTTPTACASGTMISTIDDETGVAIVRLDGVTPASCEADRFVAVCETD